MTSKHDVHGFYTNYEETPDELILDGTKVSWHQERIKKWEKGERIAPITIDLALTRSCNYGCHFCYAMVQENDRSVITKEHIDSFLEDAAEIGVKGISLISDGESTVSPLYTHAVVKGGTLGISMASGTNGFLLTPEKLNKILPHLTYLRFNISAGEPARYAQIIGCKEKWFHKVVENIKSAVKIKIKINSIITKKNQPINFTVIIDNNFSKKFSLKNINELKDNSIFIKVDKNMLKKEIIYIKFIIDNPTTRLELLESPDARKLGILVESLELINN